MHLFDYCLILAVLLVVTAPLSLYHLREFIERRRFYRWLDRAGKGGQA